MACGKFNFGHASKWDRQQIIKKSEAKVAVSDMADTVDKLQEAARDFERKIYEAALKAEEDSEKAQKALADGEWIWVEGYKATRKDMTCRGYQFEINKQFDMPEGAEIEDCKSGFHFCRDLKDVFDYYKVMDGNRFFKVHALVRKKDYEEYGKSVTIEVANPFYYMYGYDLSGSHSTTTRTSSIRDKLTSKSIVFLRELTPDEVFGPLGDNFDGNVWTSEDKKLAMEHNIDYVRNIYKARILVDLGYSEAFAKYIVDEGKFKAAAAAGSQEGLSMDMKVAFILREDD